MLTLNICVKFIFCSISKTYDLLYTYSGKYFSIIKISFFFGHSSSSLYPQHTSQWARQIVTYIWVFKLQNYMKQNFCFTTTSAFYMSEGLSPCVVIQMQNALKAHVFVMKLVANCLWRLWNF